MNLNNNINNKDDNNDIILISNDLIVKEDSCIIYHVFYDLIDNIKIDIIEYDNKLFISKKFTSYGAIAIGNNLNQNNKILLVSKINPLLLMIKIIHYVLGNNQNIYRSKEDILDLYIEAYNNNTENLKKNIPNIYNKVLTRLNVNSIMDYLKLTNMDLSLIADEKTDYEYKFYKYNKEAILAYINSKIRCTKFCNEKDDNNNNIFKENLSILKEFIPDCLIQEIIDQNEIHNYKKDIAKTYNYNYLIMKNKNIVDKQVLKYKYIKKSNVDISSIKKKYTTLDSFVVKK